MEASTFGFRQVPAQREDGGTDTPGRNRTDDIRDAVRQLDGDDVAGRYSELGKPFAHER